MHPRLIKSKLILAGALVLILGVSNTGAASADTIGERHNFFVNSKYDATGRTSVPATLEYTGTHSYVYVEDEYTNTLSPSERLSLRQKISELGQEFDNNIYNKETAFWGSEPNPGIDSDPRVTILLERLTSGTGGYFDSANEYTLAESNRSNQREMITGNVSSIWSGQLKIFIAHELQHLISFNQKELPYRMSEDIWLNELRSQYAITVAGYNDNFRESDLIKRAQSFFDAPEDSLTEWPNTGLDYSSVTLFGQYLFDRFGQSILYDTLHSSLMGIDSINKYLAGRQSSQRFVDVFADWTWTNYYNNQNPDARYGYINPNLRTAHVSPTDIKQLFSKSLNSFSFSLKPWQPVLYQFYLDTSADPNKNIKISWQGPEFEVYYADSSGAERHINNGDVISQPVGNFLLIPINKSKTSNFGPKEVAATIAMSVNYTDEPTTSSALSLKDGALITHAGTPDIYVVWGTYKRYLAPEVLKFYGLDPATAILVPEAVFQSYMPSNYIRAIDEKKVYAVWPDGTKHWLNMTAQHFTDSYRDWNSVFIVNNLESNFYKLGPDITQ